MSRNRRRRMVGEPVIIPPSESEPVVWSGLPKTRLQIVGDELVWLDSDGDVIFVIPLAAIEDVTLRVRPNPAGGVLMLFAIGLGAIGAFVSESSTLTAILYVFALAFFLLAALTVTSRWIVIRAGGTTTPIFAMQDSKAHVVAFIVSIQNAIRTAKRIESTLGLPPGSGQAPIG